MRFHNQSAQAHAHLYAIGCEAFIYGPFLPVMQGNGGKISSIVTILNHHKYDSIGAAE